MNIDYNDLYPARFDEPDPIRENYRGIAEARKNSQTNLEITCAMDEHANYGRIWIGLKKWVEKRKRQNGILN